MRFDFGKTNYNLFIPPTSPWFMSTSKFILLTMNHSCMQMQHFCSACSSFSRYSARRKISTCAHSERVCGAFTATQTARQVHGRAYASIRIANLLAKHATVVLGLHLRWIAQSHVHCAFADSPDDVWINKDTGAKEFSHLNVWCLRAETAAGKVSLTFLDCGVIFAG